MCVYIYINRQKKASCRPPFCSGFEFEFFPPNYRQLFFWLFQTVESKNR